MTKIKKMPRLTRKMTLKGKWYLGLMGSVSFFFLLSAALSV